MPSEVLGNLLRLVMFRRIIIGLSVALNLGGFIGLFTLPEDIPVALQRMGAIAMWFERETILIGLFELSSLGFGWVVLQPAISRWLEQRRTPPLKVDYPAEINSEAKYGINKIATQYLAKDAPKDEPTFGRVVVTQYFFEITNTTSRTISNVSAQIHMIENPLPYFLERKLITRNAKAVFDIRPGYTELVQLGFSHRYSRDGIAEHHSIIDMADFKKLQEIWKSKYDPGLMITLEENRQLPLLRNDNLRVIVGLYGDDIRPTHHKFTLNCKDKISIYYDGPVNLNEALEPRRPKGTGQNESGP